MVEIKSEKDFEEIIEQPIEQVDNTKLIEEEVEDKSFLEHEADLNQGSGNSKWIHIMGISFIVLVIIGTIIYGVSSFESYEVHGKVLASGGVCVYEDGEEKPYKCYDLGDFVVTEEDKIK